MALYRFATATGAIAASATNQNVLAGDKIAQAGYARTLQGMCVVIEANTPTIGDLTWRLYAGPTLLGQGEGVVAASTGAAVKVPDDFTPIQNVIPAAQVITLEITNADGAAAHGAIVHFMFDRL